MQAYSDISNHEKGSDFQVGRSRMAKEYNFVVWRWKEWTLVVEVEHLELSLI